MSDDTGAIPPANHACKDCAFFTQVDPLTTLGECRIDPPSVAGPTAMPTSMSYRTVYANTPACSQLMSPEEWAIVRSKFREAVARLAAKHGEAELVVPIRP